MAQIECLLWDFGDTLCDERFIWDSGPEWLNVYESFDHDGLGTQWSLGNINAKEFAAAISSRVERTPESTLAHMTACCDSLDFFAKTYEFFQARHLPQAIVTVNPDLFSDIIVPLYNLQHDCEVIVTSWEERTADKRTLNRLAIKQLGLDCANDAALLIDNKRSNIDGWLEIGGAGYHYSGDETFAKDADHGIDALAEYQQELPLP